MSADELSRSIETMHDCMITLSDYVARAAGASEVVGEVEGLRAALAELRTVEQGLRQQTEELAATRQAVERERQRYRDLFEFAPDGYLVTDPRGTIEEANRAASLLLGVEAARLSGKPLTVFVALDDRPSFRARLTSLASDGLGRTWTGRLTSRQGRLIPVAMTVASVPDESGTVTALRWMLRDIGDIWRAEAEIHALNAALEQRVAERTAQLEATTKAKDSLLVSEQAARAAAEAVQQRLMFLAKASGVLGASLDEPTVMHSLARQCVPTLADYCLVFSASERSLRLTAVAHADASRERLVWQLAGNVAVAASDTPSHPLMKVLHAGRPAREPTEADLWSVAGTRSPRALAAFRELGCRSYLVLPLRARGGVVGALALVTAESDRQFTPVDLATAEEVALRAAAAVDNARLLQQAEAAVQARDAFLASVSHDLRTPLTGVRGVVQLLQRRLRRGAPTDDEAIRQSLAMIDESAGRMAAMIDELVDIGHVQAGKPLLLSRQPTDLVALTRTSIAQHQRATTRHQLRLVTDETAVVGQWDAARLERVLDNLLANAVKYSPAGGDITVTMAVEHDETGRWARLTVADQGVGIPAVDLPHLFERFHRGSNVVGRISGSGIGLATVFHLVDQHGGRVAIDSEEGRGATVTVRLPLKPSAV